MNGTPMVIVVVTGGPCGGKSTFMVRAREWLEKFGYHLLVVSETATELITAGASPSVMGLRAFQENLLQYSLMREHRYREIAGQLSAENVVILCNGGVADCAAYMGMEHYRRMVDELNWPHADLLNRYDLVVHLVTAANGAEEYYTLANNSARQETPEQARVLDAETATAWLGHPHHIVVDNSTGFEQKMLRALRALSRKLNMPEPTGIRRKYRVKDFSSALLPEEAVVSTIRQDYLVGSGPSVRRVRKRIAHELPSYFYAEEIPTGDSVICIEKERTISQEEYQQFLANERNPRLLTLEMTRWNFRFDREILELDMYGEKHAGLSILKVELLDGAEDVAFPPGFDVDDITDDRRYDDHQLAVPAALKG